MASNRRVALHVDVTGTKDIEKQRVIKIDATSFGDGKEEHYERTFNPQRSISAAATKYHGLSNRTEEVKDGPKFTKKAALDLRTFIGNAEVFAHVAFTTHILNNELRRLKVKPLDKEDVNYTFQMFKKLHSNIAKPELGTIAAFYGVKADCDSNKIVKVVKEMEAEAAEREKASHADSKHKDAKHSSFIAQSLFKKPLAKPVVQLQSDVPFEERVGLFQMGIG